jgi:hypothetical protein
MRTSRRQFIKLAGGATTAWPLAAHAQQPGQMRRIGVLMNRTADEGTRTSTCQRSCSPAPTR